MAFNSLPANARVWIYQGNREYSEEEISWLKNRLTQCVSDWTSHSRKVIAAAEVVYNRFLIFVADESAFQVSGCSIDSSVRFVKDVESQLKADLFNRLNVAWREGDEIKSAAKDEFEALLRSGQVDENTIVFNNLVQTKEQLEKAWEVPVKESWHKMMLATA